MGVLMLRIVDVEEDEVAAEVLAPDEWLCEGVKWCEMVWNGGLQGVR